MPLNYYYYYRLPRQFFKSISFNVTYLLTYILLLISLHESRPYLGKLNTIFLLAF